MSDGAPFGPGSREPDPQAVPALPGFDPSRGAIRKTALISPCGTYRYRLTRHWDSAVEPLTFVMLNPSTADAEIDDPTIRRCIGFARREGYGGIVVVNLYALRATDPNQLGIALDPCGPGNGRQLDEAVNCAGGGPIVCAWGTKATIGNAAADFIKRATENYASLVSLGITKDGHPRHPLYVRADQPFVPFPASGIAARSDETHSVSAEGKSPAPKADAP